MRLGIMQPYFLPYLGYFDLINITDRWIVFDKIQYIRHGWVNRNRILHPTEGWQYIGVPLEKHSRYSLISEVKAKEGWSQRILAQLMHYRRRAPFFEQVYSFLEQSFQIESTMLSEVNVSLLKAICDFLEINFDYQVFSKMNIDIGEVDEPGDWALRISEALGASQYVNPPGGETLFEPSRFEESGIELRIRRFPVFEYECPGYCFEPNLSIVDVLMWNSKETVRNYLNKVKNEFEGRSE
ncbi:MAG TPA: WbqC family protein [Mesotoga infera]|nr:WbqC family protein [Mesotoga infera]HRV02968.1 WbqC family protein [Mesotoga sp.]